VILVAGRVRSVLLPYWFEIDTERFESFQGSQPVESLRRDLHGCRNPRHSGKLGGEGGVSGLGFTHYRRSIRRFSDAGLCSVNFNIRTGRRQTGSIMGRDRLRIAYAERASRSIRTSKDRPPHGPRAAADGQFVGGAQEASSY